MSRRFAPPAIAAHEIVRPRLLGQIAHVTGLGEATFTLVLGPAGFGKTTLLAQAYRELQSAGRHPLWLECSELDADPAHLIDSLYAAGSLAGMTSGDFEFTAGDLARRIGALDGPVTLFLDAFERLVGSDAELLVDRILGVLPPDSRIVAASRQAPGTWFLQRELRGLASVVEARELRMTHPELVALLPTRFSADEIERVARVTEGWPVVVQMTRLRAGETTSIAEMLDRLPHDSLGLFDYLASRVMEALSPEQRTLLRDTSILAVITPSLANALLERDDAFALISGVLRLQPIVTVTGDRELTVRLHLLFRQYLRRELARQGKDYEVRLQRRAATALAAAGSIYEAVQHALAADDVDYAVELFERAGGASLVFHIGPPQLHRLAATLPPQARAKSVQLLLTDLILATLEGRARAAAALRDELGRALATVGSRVSVAWRDHAVGMADALVNMLCDLHEGLRPGAIERCLQTERIARLQFPTDETYLGLALAIEVFLQCRYRSLPEGRRALSDYVALCERNRFAPRLPSVSPQRALVAFLAGDYDAACALLARSPGKPVDRFAEPEPLLVQLSTAMLATIHYERNELDAAWRLARDLAVDPDRVFPETWALTARARILSLEALGQAIEADRVLAQERSVAHAYDAPRMLILLDAVDLELRVRRAGPGAGAAQLAAALEDELGRTESSWLLVVQLARAAVAGLLVEGEGERARALAERFTASMIERGHGAHAALGHLLVARAAEVLGDEADSRSHLAAALAGTAATRSVRPYVDLGFGPSSLIRMLADPDVAGAGEHLRAVLRTLEAVAPAIAPAWGSLSERERDVLSALAAHASTKSIAKQLGLSPETVKHHLKRIYGKLGVHSRDAALKRAAGLDA